MPYTAPLQPNTLNMENDQREELQLLPSPSSLTRVSRQVSKPVATSPGLDLSLSINTGRSQPYPNKEAESNMRSIQAVKRHNAEQIRLAAVERAYAERVRELTKRELEIAEKEFSRARMIWERAREDMEKVERMKMAASRRVGSSCIEITCQACRQRFQA